MSSKVSVVEEENKDIFLIAKQMKKEIKDVGENCKRDDQGHILLTDVAKKIFITNFKCRVSMVP